jgi:hypothetical protein
VGSGRLQINRAQGVLLLFRVEKSLGSNLTRGEGVETWSSFSEEAIAAGLGGGATEVEEEASWPVQWLLASPLF